MGGGIFLSLAGNFNGVPILLILMLLLIVSSVMTVLFKSVLKAAICLGLTSALLTIVLFLMKAYLAAVFELSVCAGLITVVFISTVSLTKPGNSDETVPLISGRLSRHIILPIILVIAATGLYLEKRYFGDIWVLKNNMQEAPVRDMLWNTRSVDMLGQVIIVLSGVFGVAVLFKERGSK